MNEYKRLTERYVDGQGTNCVRRLTWGGETLHRLAELEDKIENGTLIDTKVKIGQRVFRHGFFKGEIDEYIVSNIVLENGELKLHLKHDFDEHKTCYSATILSIEEIGKTVFLTKVEAEAKLKELQQKSEVEE